MPYKSLMKDLQLSDYGERERHKSKNVSLDACFSNPKDACFALAAKI